MSYNVLVDCAGVEIQKLDKAGFKTLNAAKEYVHNIVNKKLVWEEDDYNIWIASDSIVNFSIIKD